ncbi:cupin-like domain-containing protein [Mesorhizobium sp. AR02]|uniref:cupin-like domain-containing protein n=1 Tax=Mesorhizobium sp. AR02 TaxID=2865837 RepID=UPI00215E8A7E|nr:cupin-like domain-containing protein [Mesorhizobium sp. AR02]UVK51420.1 cupin-like domain-containing protein [Mesorhizobium sp. AR02]
MPPNAKRSSVDPVGSVRRQRTDDIPVMAERSLPIEWRTWIAENRILGTSPDVLVESAVKAGYFRHIVEEELRSERDNPYCRVAELMTKRYLKLKSVLQVRKALRNLAFNAQTIERRSKISRSEFLERYYAANRPVILTGMLAGSAARRDWTPEYLAEMCGSANVQIMAGRGSDPHYELNSDLHRRELNMAEYVSMVTAGGSSNDYYLVANNHFFEREEFAKLYDQAPRIDEYINHNDGKKKTFFWFGPSGTITPLHHDLMNVLVAQIFGKKRFILLSPEDTPFVYNEVGCYGGVDCSSPDYNIHPLYSEASPITLTLFPGDVLFIPVGWWHYVQSIDISIMVSYTNFHYPNEFNWYLPRP